MTRRLSEDDFAKAVNRTKLPDASRYIAYQNLVEGMPQVKLAGMYDMTPQSISRIAKRVWDEHLNAQELPDGMRRITVVLPEEQAVVALAWAREARKQRR